MGAQPPPPPPPPPSPLLTSPPLPSRQRPLKFFRFQPSGHRFFLAALILLIILTPILISSVPFYGSGAEQLLRTVKIGDSSVASATAAHLVPILFTVCLWFTLHRVRAVDGITCLAPVETQPYDTWKQPPCHLSTIEDSLPWLLVVIFGTGIHIYRKRLLESLGHRTPPRRAHRAATTTPHHTT